MRLSEILSENKDRFITALKGNQSVILAYSEGSGKNLDIHGTPVSLDEWRKVMSFALDNSQGYYNEFSVDKVAKELRMLLQEFDISENDVKFVPAREYSVALYILGDIQDLLELEEVISVHRRDFSHVDEVNVKKENYRGVKGPSLRLWWD